jgi:Flp pilus assembly protein TadG
MTGRAETLRAKILHFCQESSGGVMIYVGIMLPILMGIASLAVDVGLWYANKRVVQSVADAAALGGALEVRRKGDLSTLQLAATEYATENGYNGTDDTIDINSPPESGPLIGVATAVEVIVERPAPSFLSSLVNKGQTTIAARAVASYGTAEACIWALNPTASGAVTVSGNAQVNMNCGIMANSSSPSAITQNGASCINAASVASVGGASGGCINPPPVTTSYAADPMSYVSGPSWSGCDHPNQIKANNNQTVNLAPGVYCNKITAQNGGTLNFASGLYVLDGAALTIHGEANGTDVQFYLTENTAQNDNITINAGSTVQLSAPDFESDLPAGVLFYQDRNSTAGINHTMNGQTDMLLEGILYLPNGDVNFSGGGAADPTATVIIADEISFTGNSEFGNYILSPTASNPQLVTVTLVE